MSCGLPQMLGLLSYVSAMLVCLDRCHKLVCLVSCHMHRLQALLDFLCIDQGMLAVAIISFPEGGCTDACSRVAVAT